MLDRQLFKSLARKPDPNNVPTAPICPLPATNGHPPVLLVFDENDRGVELAYERKVIPDGPLVRSAKRETGLYFLPSLMPVFAVNPGTVVYAAKHTDGFCVVLDHKNGWMTMYAHLQHLFVRPTTRKPRIETELETACIIGIIGSRSGPLRTLRFELWRCNAHGDYESVDPIRYMHRWRVLPWNDHRFKSVEVAAPRAA